MANIVHHAESLDDRVAGLAFEAALLSVVERAVEPGRCPPGLASAIRYGVFPGGARLRPRLLAAVAFAAGEPSPEALEAACVAVELLHCASLVHDDLPCFDDAETRRGRPALPRVYGEARAVLVGDALIVLALEQAAEAAGHADVASGAAVLKELARAAGANGGLVAGQAWELEATAPLDEYHRAKTGSLFTFAARAGALVAGGCADRWGEVGRLLGKAYQTADDLADAAATSVETGKSTGRDEALGRPSVVRALGPERARAQVRHAIAEALDAIPEGPRSGELRFWLSTQLVHAGIFGAVGV